MSIDSGGEVSLSLDFGREVCGDLSSASTREWLVTNGLGGFASGTIGGLLTRRYHGLLIAALQPPVGRVLLVTKFDEIAAYGGREYALSANRWADGIVAPEGFRNVERFRLEGAVPVWTFACADALLEKRVWMQPGANTTYAHYHLRRATGPLTLTVKALVNYRDYHGLSRGEGWQFRIAPVAHGLRVVASDEAAPYCLLSDRAEATPRHTWYRNYALRAEQQRGFEGLEDHLYAGKFRAMLEPGQSLTLLASAEPDPGLNGAEALAERRSYERALLALDPDPGAAAHGLDAAGRQWARQLVLAADQFVVRRATEGDPDGRTIIAGYPWFGDWGRDTMISLPGLTLATGRLDVARRILRTFARHVDRGMLPNRFPDAGEAPEYNTVDATLWYFEALRAYQAAAVRARPTSLTADGQGSVGDVDLLRELLPVLEDIIAWHQRGTRYHIHMDPADGLIYAGEPGLQLTWMDAKVGDWVVTPRIGKPVEINALWYNALRVTAEFARQQGKAAEEYDSLADRVLSSFARFWNQAAACCYDVIDSPAPHGDDASVRPNQLLAVSLPHSPLTHVQQKAVVDVCARHLLTSHGLRSLSPDDPAYAGSYGGDAWQRDAAYHQGTVWAWLIGPFVSAHLRVYGDPALARSYLTPLLHHLADHGLGSIGEIFDGDPPHAARGCIAQAWSVAEVLRVLSDMDRL